MRQIKNSMATVKLSPKKENRNAARITHNKPCLDEKDAQSAYDAVLSGWVAYGDIGCRLEQELSQRILGQDDAAVLCSSGTSGIYLALNALNIKDGDEIILPSYVCTALLNAILMTGARTVLVDIEPDNLSLTAGIAKKHITSRTRAIIAVHSYGIPCELDDLLGLGIPVVEDCAQGLGSSFADGSRLGSKGDMSVFSFYATKSITGGYGGALLSKHDKYIDSVRDYINFDNPEQYQPRFNFMLSDINAAVALSQFGKLDRFMTRRIEIGRQFTDAIGNREFHLPSIGSDKFNHFRYLIHMKTESDLIALQEYLASNNIDSIIPLENYELLHNYLEIDRSSFPAAEQASKTILSLPVYPCLSNEEIDRIVACLGEWSFA